MCACANYVSGWLFNPGNKRAVPTICGRTVADYKDIRNVPTFITKGKMMKIFFSAGSKSAIVPRRMQFTRSPRNLREWSNFEEICVVALMLAVHVS